jgi:hypothetical protein
MAPVTPSPGPFSLSALQPARPFSFSKEHNAQETKPWRTDNATRPPDQSNEAIVSGRITTHHKLSKGTEPGMRTGDGPWLILDQPLLAELSGAAEVTDFVDCGKWRKIAILTGEQSQIDQSQLRRWANQHETIKGKLGRFGSALVSPAIFIEITTIKKD